MKICGCGCGKRFKPLAIQQKYRKECRRKVANRQSRDNQRARYGTAGQQKLPPVRRSEVCKISDIQAACPRKASNLINGILSGRVYYVG